MSSQAMRLGEAALGDFAFGGLRVGDVVGGRITPVLIGVAFLRPHVDVALRRRPVAVGLRSVAVSTGLDEALVLAR